MNLPANIPRGQLPQSYEAAKVAIAKAAKVDECKNWSDKMAAVASYARQADDDSLQKYAERIRARAIRRSGELLQEFDAQGRRTDLELRGCASPKSGKPGRYEVGKDAGMSRDQVKQAVRVAKIPEEQFEAAVESDDPPTITQLVERQSTEPLQPGFEPPPYFREATNLAGDLRRLDERLQKLDPDAMVAGFLTWEHEEVIACVDRIGGWLQRFRKAIDGRPQEVDGVPREARDPRQ